LLDLHDTDLGQSLIGEGRTSAIVILDGDIATIRHVAAQAVDVYDLNHLPGAFAYLTPRQWVA